MIAIQFVDFEIWREKGYLLKTAMGLSRGSIILGWKSLYVEDRERKKEREREGERGERWRRREREARDREIKIYVENFVMK